MKCETCKYWNPEPYRLTPQGQNSADPTRTLPAGTCRLDSPWVGVNNFRTWPVTVESDWCHKWTNKFEGMERVTANEVKGLVSVETAQSPIVLHEVSIGEPVNYLKVPSDLTDVTPRKRGRKKSS